VRHFLIEPTTKGVKLKGYSNEPVFASLSALIYQHTLTPLALPTRLVLPLQDLGAPACPEPSASAQMQQLLHLGAACNVHYLFTMDTDQLTGPQVYTSLLPSSSYSSCSSYSSLSSSLFSSSSFRRCGRRCPSCS